MDKNYVDEPNFLRLNVADEYERLSDIAKNQDAVIHLALDIRGSFMAKASVPENYRMSENIYRAANGATPHPRVIVASSVHAVGGYIDWNKEPYASMVRKDFTGMRDLPRLITPDMPPFSDSPYGAMKVHMEELGKILFSVRVEGCCTKTWRSDARRRSNNG